MSEYVGKHAKKQHRRHSYQSMRYVPGTWNGLCGGANRAQYFYAGDMWRMIAMFEIAMLLHEKGIRFTITIWKDYYRILITGDDYNKMPESIRDTVFNINMNYYSENW